MNSTQSAYIFSSTISLNQMISLVTEIEAEVYASPIYCNALATLTKNSKNEKTTNSLLKKITRSAIRVAFQKFLSIPEFQREPLPVQPFDLSTPPLTNLPKEAMTQENLPSYTMPSTFQEAQSLPKQEEPNIVQAIAESSESTYPNKFDDLVSKAKELETKIYHSIEKFIIAKPATEATPIAQDPLNNTQETDRHQRLQEIGGQIREARLAKSITIAQINVNTAISPHKIEAIEEGCLEKLPEEIYLQGYIRRLGNAVGLDGDRLAHYFLSSPPNPIEHIKKTDNKNSDKTNQPQKIYLKSTHLFWVYISLMASSLGILSLIGNNTDPSRNIIEKNKPELDNLPIKPEAEKYQMKKYNPELPTPERHNTAFLSIAPPETI
jgi:hypothetical protein